MINADELINKQTKNKTKQLFFRGNPIYQATKRHKQTKQKQNKKLNILLSASLAVILVSELFQPKAINCFSSTSHFSQCNCYLSVVLQHDEGDYTDNRYSLLS